MALRALLFGRALASSIATTSLAAASMRGRGPRRDGVELLRAELAVVAHGRRRARARAPSWGPRRRSRLATSLSRPSASVARVLEAAATPCSSAQCRACAPSTSSSSSKSSVAPSRKYWRRRCRRSPPRRAAPRGRAEPLGLGLDLLLELGQVGRALLLIDRGDDRGGEVEDLLELLGSDVEQVADAARHALEEPDVADGRGQVDVAHALAAHLLARDLHAAALADDALVADALVLAAVALPVLGGTEDALAEQAVLLGLERAVVDRLRLGDLAERPVADLLGDARPIWMRRSC